jgi:hypothetical protein
MSGLLLALLLLQAPTALQQNAGVVMGVVLTEKRVPLEGVRVAVTPADAILADSLLESIGLTDKDGRYRLENVSPGLYHVLFGRSTAAKYHPGVKTTEGATTIQVTAGGTTAVPSFIVQRIGVRGRVVDMATGMGRSIQSLSVCCDDSNIVASTFSSATTLFRPTGTPFGVTVHDDGTFAFSLPPHATAQMQATDPSILAVGQTVSVGDTDLTEVVIKVSAGVELQGEVVDRFGTPVTGASVRLLRKAGSTVPILIAQNGFLASQAPPTPSDTVREGRFTLRRLLPGTYILEVISAGVNSVEREIEIPTYGTMQIRVDLPFTQIPGRIVAADDGPIPTVRNIRLLTAPPEERYLYGFPDESGQFFLLLAPGEYRISTFSMGHAVRSITVGSKELKDQPFVFDGIDRSEIRIIVE